MAHVVRQLIRTSTGNELKDDQFNSWPEARAFMLTLDLPLHESIVILDDVGSTMFEYVNPHEDTPTKIVLPEPEVVDAPADVTATATQEVQVTPTPKKSKKSAPVVDTPPADPAPTDAPAA